MEQTIYVRSDQNNCNHLWRWSTLTSLVISLPLSIWQNCCLYYCSYCRTCSGLGQISSADSTIPFREWNFQNFNPEFLLNRKHSLLLWQSCALAAPGGHWCLHVTFALRWPDNHMLGILDFIGSEQSGLPSIFLTAKPHMKMKSLHRMNVNRHFCSPDFDFFFWRILHLHQQLMFIMSLSTRKLGNISYMYNVLTAVNDWLWQKDSSELQLICLV